MRFTNLIGRVVAIIVLAPSGLATAQSGAVVETGIFHGVVHKTTGRATIYDSPNGQILRLTRFTTSNGPNLHVLLIAASDAQDDENFAGKEHRTC